MRSKKRQHKYSAKKTTIDGIKFDSKTEACYYIMLKHLKKNGVIKGFSLQPKFELQPKFKYQDKNIQSINYVLDFKVEYVDGVTEYIDIKGVATPVSRMKLKMVQHQYPDLNFKWISYSKTHGDSYGWIEFEELQKIKRKNKRK